MAFDARAATQDILQRVKEAGFALAGIAPVRASARAEQVRAWLKAGRHGTMDYLERDLTVRLSPEKILPGARAFIMVGDQYASRNDGAEAAEWGRGRIARYARGRNYHEVMKRRLHRVADALRIDYPGAEFRTFVDTAPVLERELACLAGLGWQAKNTMLIHPRIGSYFLLGGMATTLALEPATEGERVPDSCGTCTRCIDACPTKAIAPYSVDASRCISYLTIEREGAIPREFHAAMGDWLFGCDVCQEVCPHNSARGAGGDVGAGHEAYAPRNAGFDLLEVLGWDRDARERALRTSAMKRATLAMFQRNAVIGAANALSTREDPELRERVQRLTQDPGKPELVRRTAETVLRGAGGS